MYIKEKVSNNLNKIENVYFSKNISYFAVNIVLYESQIIYFDCQLKSQLKFYTQFL